MTQLKEKVKQLSIAIAQEVVDYRRHLHAHPELSFHEYQTSSFVESTLKAKGIEVEQVKEDIAQTGLVAYVRGRNPESKVVALRADMDALPIKEQNDISYKSQNEG